LAGAEEYAHIIKQIAHNSSGQTPARDISALIKEGEGFLVEFKETLRLDKRRNEVSKEMEKAVIKTIVAFLNSEGGTLLIGVSDSGEVTGLQRDYETLPKKNRDGFENHFTQVFNKMLGPEFRTLVKLWFNKIDGHEICVVQTLKGTRPVYLKLDQNEHFYIRTGNSTAPLKMSEAESYNNSRFQNTNV